MNTLNFLPSNLQEHLHLYQFSISLLLLQRQDPFPCKSQLLLHELWILSWLPSQGPHTLILIVLSYLSFCRVLLLTIQIDYNISSVLKKKPQQSIQKAEMISLDWKTKSNKQTNKQTSNPRSNSMLSMWDKLQVQKYKQVENKRMEKDISCKQQP